MTSRSIANSRRRRFHAICRLLSFLISACVFFANYRSKFTSPIAVNNNNISSAAPSADKALSSSSSSPNNSIIDESYINEYINEYLEATTPRSQWTLVHYDPYLMGGLRNQHMRFVAFVNKAVEHNISQILLPSLRWGDALHIGKSAPHEMLFDVVHWNKRADEFGLPRFVRYDAAILEKKINNINNNNEDVVSCFNTTSNLYSGLDERKWRSKLMNLRKESVWDYLGKPMKYAHCKHSLDNSGTNSNLPSEDDDVLTYLIPHGGTKMSGRLWWEYDGMQQHRRKPDIITGQYPDHLPVEKAIFKILRPSLPIRRAIQTYLDEAIVDSSTSLPSSSSLSVKPTVVALHPRVEYEMFDHICGKYIQSNLSSVFESLKSIPKFDLLFLAVNRARIDGPLPDDIENVPSFRRMANENIALLKQTRHYGLFGTEEKRGIPILEAGTSTASKIQFPIMERQRTSSSSSIGSKQGFVTAKSLGVIDLVASVVNFFTVLEADVFVGVRGSTYSMDAISVRYYNHQDSSGDDGGVNNLVVGPTGIKQFYGPAEPLPCK